MKTMERIEVAREARLWLRQIIAPVAIASAIVFSDAENRRKAKAGLEKGKEKITNMFNKN